MTERNKDKSDLFEEGIEGVGKIVGPIVDGIGKIVDNAGKAFGDIGKSFAEGLNASDSEDSRHIYQNIANVLKQKFQENDATCLNAVHILFNETDKKAIQLAESAKRNLLAVKVHYEKAEKSRDYKRTTEVFFKNPKDNKITVSRIEDEKVSWDILPSDVRELSLKEGKNKVSYQIYPLKS